MVHVPTGELREYFAVTPLNDERLTVGRALVATDVDTPDPSEWSLHAVRAPGVPR